MAAGGGQGDQPPLMLNKDLDGGEHHTGGRLDRRRTGVQRRDEVPRVLEVGKGCTATKTGSGQEKLQIAEVLPPKEACGFYKEQIKDCVE